MGSLALYWMILLLFVLSAISTFDNLSGQQAICHSKSGDIVYGLGG